VAEDHSSPLDGPGQTVALRGGGLATSSTTVRRWKRGERELHHILDPASGRPAQECWRTVSVAAACCVDANIASTAAIVRGGRAPDWLESLGLPSRLVAIDGTVSFAAGWPEGEHSSL
jgi:thiamine biosynthesis lipoprotein